MQLKKIKITIVDFFWLIGVLKNTDLHSKVLFRFQVLVKLSVLINVLVFLSVINTCHAPSTCTLGQLSVLVFLSVINTCSRKVSDLGISYFNCPPPMEIPDLYIIDLTYYCSNS